MSFAKVGLVLWGVMSVALLVGMGFGVMAAITSSFLTFWAKGFIIGLIVALVSLLLWMTLLIAEDEYLDHCSSMTEEQLDVTYLNEAKGN
jgi:hypothetical protein